MPRWTKENWAKLDKDERVELVYILQRLGKPSWSSAYYPDDVSLCPCCCEPTQLCGCYEIMQILTAKMGVECPDI